MTSPCKLFILNASPCSPRPSAPSQVATSCFDQTKTFCERPSVCTLGIARRAPATAELALQLSSNS